MAYKSPLDLADAIAAGEQPWQPHSWRDVTKFHQQIPGSKFYSFNDGDYSGYARVYDQPSENNINKGRVSNDDFLIKYRGRPIQYIRDVDHSDFRNKILAWLESYNPNL